MSTFHLPLASSAKPAGLHAPCATCLLRITSGGLAAYGKESSESFGRGEGFYDFWWGNMFLHCNIGQFFVFFVLSFSIVVDSFQRYDLFVQVCL